MLFVQSHRWGIGTVFWQILVQYPNTSIYHQAPAFRSLHISPHWHQVWYMTTSTITNIIVQYLVFCGEKKSCLSNLKNTSSRVWMGMPFFFFDVRKDRRGVAWEWLVKLECNKFAATSSWGFWATRSTTCHCPSAAVQTSTSSAIWQMYFYNLTLLNKVVAYAASDIQTPSPLTKTGSWSHLNEQHESPSERYLLKTLGRSSDWDSELLQIQNGGTICLSNRRDHTRPRVARLSASILFFVSISIWVLCPHQGGIVRSEYWYP